MRRRLLVGGIVQGVGFRPFVFNLAESLELKGLVTNTSEGVIIEIQGPAPALDLFEARLQEQAPPLADIRSVASAEMPLVEGAGAFIIAPSENRPGTRTLIPPDVATCADCRREILDPENRRHGYPFTNCTSCGPRWTIIGRIPYDRPFTSMAAFTMCPDCQAEYDNPRDRRFHAQPNACPVCGPRVWWEDPDHPEGRVDEDVLPLVARQLAAGKIVAIKGLGGFHLAVRADSEEAVARLRQRKNREAKPLAVMVADLACAEILSQVSREEAKLLQSPASPIVLLEKRAKNTLAPGVCQGHRRVGVMLAYTPLHILLMDELARFGVTALVMTSGNASDEPICLGNDEARTRLAHIADGWLLHDRDIVRRADDSVVQWLPCGPLFFRRSRGLAPVPVPLSTPLDQGPAVLAVGPELKNTICLLKEDQAFLSPHIGDLQNLEAHGFFRETVDTLQDVLESRPEVVAHDLHPGYSSTVFARQLSGVRCVGVQHHHAHLAAVMAEMHLEEPAIGLILDGTGYGIDGTIWGGEVLVGDCAGFTRFAHLDPVPLPGGDAAIKAPWRTAVSYLRHAFGDDLADWPQLPFLTGQPVAPLLEILDRGLNSPLTSSCGRLFDAVAAMTGLWPEAHYEAQAAIEFMALTNLDEVDEAEPLAIFHLDGLPHEPLVLPVDGIIRGAAQAVVDGESPAEISARFHRTLLDLMMQVTLVAHRDTGLEDVVLAGGVFQNDLLVQGMWLALRDFDLRPWRSLQCPPNDGAVALGQAAVARARI